MDDDAQSQSDDAAIMAALGLMDDIIARMNKSTADQAAFVAERRADPAIRNPFDMSDFKGPTIADLRAEYDQLVKSIAPAREREAKRIADRERRAQERTAEREHRDTTIASNKIAIAERAARDEAQRNAELDRLTPQELAAMGLRERRAKSRESPPETFIDRFGRDLPAEAEAKRIAALPKAERLRLAAAEAQKLAEGAELDDMSPAQLAELAFQRMHARKRGAQT